MSPAKTRRLAQAIAEPGATLAAIARQPDDTWTAYDGHGDVSIRGLVDHAGGRLIKLWNADEGSVCGADFDGGTCQRPEDHWGVDDHSTKPYSMECLVLTHREAQGLAAWLLEVTGGAS